jgi:hypothetical protein
MIPNTISWANKLSVERKLFLVTQINIWLSFGMKYLSSVIKGAEFWFGQEEYYQQLPPASVMLLLLGIKTEQ